MTRVPPIEITPLELEDIVRLRKPHACGGYEWKVVRLGADIGLKCSTCGRRVLLTRRDLQRRLKLRIQADTQFQSESNNLLVIKESDK
jgi:hypothetical protein